MRFTLRQLRYFVAAGEAGSIALAARRINVSSPSISAAISHLESEFGLSLFVRHHAQGLSLTPEGRRFLQETKLLLDQAEQLQALASDMTGRVRGPLSVGAFVTLAPLMLPQLRRGFQDAYPEATLRQVEGHQESLLEALRRAEIDVAITYDLQIPQDVGFEPLAELPPLALFPLGHPLAGLPGVRLDELAPLPLVLLDLPVSREYFLSLFHHAGLRPRIAERSAEIEVVRSLVANGFGYSLGNVRPPAPMAPDGAPLALVPLEGDYRPMRIGLATARTGRKPRILEAFEAHCRAAIGSQGIPGMVPLGEAPVASEKPKQR